MGSLTRLKARARGFFMKYETQHGQDYTARQLSEFRNRLLHRSPRAFANTLHKRYKTETNQGPGTLLTQLLSALVHGQKNLVSAYGKTGNREKHPHVRRLLLSTVGHGTYLIRDVPPSPSLKPILINGRNSLATRISELRRNFYVNRSLPPDLH